MAEVCVYAPLKVKHRFLYILSYIRCWIEFNIMVGQWSFREGETHGKAVPVVKVFNNALWSALRTIFRPKMHWISGFCIQSQNVYPWVVPRPDSRSGRGWPAPASTLSTAEGGAWTQTPISACLASVAVVPVLRNVHLGGCGYTTECGQCGHGSDCSVGCVLFIHARSLVATFGRRRRRPLNWLYIIPPLPAVAAKCDVPVTRCRFRRVTFRSRFFLFSDSLQRMFFLSHFVELWRSVVCFWASKIPTRTRVGYTQSGPLIRVAFRCARTSC